MVESWVHYSAGQRVFVKAATMDVVLVSIGVGWMVGWMVDWTAAKWVVD